MREVQRKIVTYTSIVLQVKGVDANLFKNITKRLIEEQITDEAELKAAIEKAIAADREAAVTAVVAK